MAKSREAMCYDVENGQVSSRLNTISDFQVHATTVLTNTENVKKFLTLSDIVTASQPLLVRLLGKYRAGPVYLMPSGIFVEKYSDGSALPLEKVTNKIVFTNGENLQLNLFHQPFFQMLDRFIAYNKHISVDYFGNQIEKMTSKDYVSCKGVFPYTEHKKLLKNAGYLFALVPLGGAEDPENMNFNRCKSPFKYFDYAAVGIPGIYSRTPIYEEVIQHGHNGLLVENNVASWLEAMDKLANNAELREKIRVNSYLDVLHNKHIRRVGNVLYPLLTQARNQPMQRSIQ